MRGEQSLSERKTLLEGFSSSLESKEAACNVGDLGLISGSGISPGGGHGNPLKYSCLENFMDRGAWQATAHGVSGLDMTEELTLHFFIGR